MTSWVSRSLFEVTRQLQSITNTELIEDLLRIADIAEEHPDFVFWHPETEAILHDLRPAASLEEISIQANRIRRTFDLQHVTVAVVHEAAGIFSRRVLTTLPPEWIQEYTAGRYQLSDPVFSEPVLGRSEFLHEFASKSPVFADYLRRARRAGIGPSGIVFWVDVSEGATLVVTLTSTNSVEEFQRRAERMESDLAEIARALASAFARANLLETNPEKLTDEELSALRGIASGVSPQASRDAMLLCRRLNAKTLIQAAIAVASTGILSYAPLRVDDFWVADAPTPDGSTFDKLHLADHLDRAPVRNPAGRGRGAAVFEVRQWRNAWAVYRDGERISGDISCEAQAEWICTQAAWGRQARLDCIGSERQVSSN